MVKSKKDICPLCGGELQPRGKVKRIIRRENGEKIFVYIARYSCKNCKHWHRVLPDNIVPYKHYPKRIIKGFNDGLYSNEDIEFENYPSESTIKRWSH